MPQTVFLTEKQPLVYKAACWLVDHSTGEPLDLSRTIIILPTSGAMRRLRGELLKVARAFLPPVMTSPLGLLDMGTADRMASRPEVLSAWATVIRRSSAEKSPLLLSGFPDHGRAALRIAQSLVEVCSILADGGLTPLSPEILQACPQDEDRWREVAALYQKYLRRLEKMEVGDPNEIRIATARQGIAPQADRIVVAGVPDLNGLVASYLARLDLPLTVLVDAADCAEARFDEWGRPDAEFWGQATLSLPEILPLADPFSEALTVSRLLGHAALCVADSELIPHHQRALQDAGRITFDPSGKPLSRFECAALARLWILFCRGGRIADLRALAEHPVFLTALTRESGLSSWEILSALDEISTGALLKFFPEAVGWYRRSEEKEGRFLRAIEVWRTTYDASKNLGPLPEFLELIYRGHRVQVGSEEAEALVALGEVLRGLLSADEEAEELFQSEIRATTIYGTHEPGAVEFHGWLEVAWLPHDAVVVSGCTEGALPSHVSSHPFLPESLRVALGLPGNGHRLARDIFLMHNLLASREPDRVRFTLSRTGASGDPLKPSRLLFRCADAQLHDQVRTLFGPVPSLRQTHARQRAWPLEVPQKEPPTHLRVTAFGDYLECPFRFYFKRVLGMDQYDPAKSEMDAMDFGNTLHLAVEAFSKDETARDLRDPAAIEKFVLAELDRVIAAQWGTQLALPVRVQRESLRARLRKFAEIQAAERAAGWRIVAAEIPFEKKDSPLFLAGLRVTAKIDRVEVHEQTGRRRILDYKTYKSAKNHRPEDVHLGRAVEGEDFPEAGVEWDGRERRWSQLQLPLYRALAGCQWPDDREPPITAYFLLPEKIEESGIFEFAMDDDVYASAIACATAVAGRVGRGLFWPPRQVLYESFDDIFLGDDPATLLTPESIAFLQGR